jgi:hypothetical protein
MSVTDGICPKCHAWHGPQDEHAVPAAGWVGSWDAAAKIYTGTWNNADGAAWTGTVQPAGGSTYTWTGAWSGLVTAVTFTSP